MWEVRNKTDMKAYAMRSINKAKLKKEDIEEIIENEIKILKFINFPFIERFANSFQSEKRIYIFTGYINGGYISNLLCDKGKLNNDYVELYAAEIALAIEYLHDHNIIHRDLKSRNVVIDENGHIRIINFWMAKVLNKPTVCPTPDVWEYSAPEVIKDSIYSKASDWWNLVISETMI